MRSTSRSTTPQSLLRCRREQRQCGRRQRESSAHAPVDVQHRQRRQQRNASGSRRVAFQSTGGDEVRQAAAASISMCC